MLGSTALECVVDVICVCWNVTYSEELLLPHTLWLLSVCIGHLSAVFTTSRHHFSTSLHIIETYLVQTPDVDVVV